MTAQEMLQESEFGRRHMLEALATIIEPHGPISATTSESDARPSQQNDDQA